MEIRQLEYFVAVAEEANFTRAAQRCLVAQPAVSAQIQRLERELGQPLFDRSRRTATLTAAGSAALPHARAVLAGVADVGAAVDEVSAVIRGTVRIGTVTSHDVDIAALLANFHTDHPAVEITLGTDDSVRLIERLRDGTVDLAIVSVGSDETVDGISLDTVTDQAIDAVVAHGHPLAHRETITLSELCEHPLIALPVGTGIRHQLDVACTAAQCSPRIAFEASTPPALVELAAHGLGVAVVPRSIALSRNDLHTVRMVPELRGRLALAWRSTGPMNPATAILVQKARRQVRTQSATSV